MTPTPPAAAIEAARKWLRRFLPADGTPVLLHDVRRAARAAGIGLPALSVAAKTLRVRSTSVRAIAWAAYREEKPA